MLDIYMFVYIYNIHIYVNICTKYILYCTINFEYSVTSIPTVLYFNMNSQKPDFWNRKLRDCKPHHFFRRSTLHTFGLEFRDLYVCIFAVML